MALRSATPFHNQWPNTTSYAALPNVSAADTTALQVGDICYDAVGDVYYYCVDSTPGAASWNPFGAGTPTPTDRQEPAIIVGNALAGDTTDVCDILDFGDGTGIAAALALALPATPTTYAQDVYVRPGVYTIDANSPITLTVPDGVKLCGAGRTRTIIVAPPGLASIVMTPYGCEVLDLTLFVSGASTSGTVPGGYITVGPSTENNVNVPFGLRRVDVLLGGGYDPANGLLYGIDISFPGAYCTFGNVLEDVRVVYIGSDFTPLPGSDFADRTAGINASLPFYEVNNPRLFVNLRNVQVVNLELGFQTDGPEFVLSDCLYDGSGFDTFSSPPTLQVGYRLRATSRFSKADSCKAYLSIPSGIAQGFSVSRLSTDANFQPCYMAFNHCTVDYTNDLFAPAGFGFILAGEPGGVIQSLRMYGCQAKNTAIGFSLNTQTEYCVAIGNSTYNNFTPLVDTGTANDFGHMQNY